MEPWKAELLLDVVDGSQFLSGAVPPLSNGKTAGFAVLCGSLDEVRQLAARAADLAPTVRAVLAPFIPSGETMAVDPAPLQVLAVSPPLRYSRRVMIPSERQECAKTGHSSKAR